MSVAAGEDESVTATPKTNEPSVFGVPVIEPDEESTRPCGSVDPEVRLQAYGAVPPWAVSVVEYGAFTAADGRTVVWIEIAGGGLEPPELGAPPPPQPGKLEIASSSGEGEAQGRTPRPQTGTTHGGFHSGPFEERSLASRTPTPEGVGEPRTPIDPGSRERERGRFPMAPPEPPSSQRVASLGRRFPRGMDPAPCPVRSPPRALRSRPRGRPTTGARARTAAVARPASRALA